MCDWNRIPYLSITTRNKRRKNLCHFRAYFLIPLFVISKKGKIEDAENDLQVTITGLDAVDTLSFFLSFRCLTSGELFLQSFSDFRCKLKWIKSRLPGWIGFRHLLCKIDGDSSSVDLYRKIAWDPPCISRCVLFLFLRSVRFHEGFV